MTATINIAGIEATIDDYRWTSRDAVLASTLNAMLDPLGPSGGDPAPDYHAALAAVEQIGGKVVKYDLPEYVAGRIY